MYANQASGYVLSTASDISNPQPPAEITTTVMGLEKQSCELAAAIESLEQRLNTVTRPPYQKADQAAMNASAAPYTALGSALGSIKHRNDAAIARLQEIISRIEI